MRCAMGKQMTAQSPVAIRLLAIVLAAAVALTFGTVASAAAPETAHAASTVSFKVKGTVDNGEAYAFVAKLNKLRASKGLSKLKVDKGLMKAAEQRAAELSVMFSHTRTDGTKCFTASKAINGENIAYGFSDADSAYETWKNSPPHYANMTRGSFKSTGVCCFERDGMTFWVNLFGNGKGSAAKKSTKASTKKYTVKLAKKYLVKGNLSFAPYSMDTDDTDTIIVYLSTRDSTGTAGTLPNSLFTFKSSNASVLTVNSKGKIASKGEGKAKLTITVKKKKSCKKSQTINVEEGSGFYW